MSADRDVTRIVRSWLHEDAHEDADRVLDMVLDLVDTTPQRRASWLARRTPSMNNYARLGLVAAAVLAVVILGIGLFGRSPDVGPTTSPTPSESAAALDPLAGRWAAPTMTCEQENATVKAAGFTDEQVSLSGWSCADGTIDHYSVRFWTPQTRALMTIVNGTAGGSQTNYRIVDDQTIQAFITDDPFCIALRYTIDGDKLTMEVEQSCNSMGNPQWNDQVALTAILQTSPFTRQP
jgi:hypothetical protein